jgi:hypothetical protein
MLLFKTLRPIERWMAMKMLNSSFVAWTAFNAEARLDPTTTVSADLKLPSKTGFYIAGNLPPVCHI